MDKRQTVEDSKFMDADEVAREKGLSEPVRASLPSRDGKVVYRLVPQSTPFGYRWWWICPCCGALRKRLYWADGGEAWHCRSCLGLVYKSQQASRRPAAK